jgi:hypothetical protein
MTREGRFAIDHIVEMASSWEGREAAVSDAVLRIARQGEVL